MKTNSRIIHLGEELFFLSGKKYIDFVGSVVSGQNVDFPEHVAVTFFLTPVFKGKNHDLTIETLEINPDFEMKLILRIGDYQGKKFYSISHASFSNNNLHCPLCKKHSTEVQNLPCQCFEDFGKQLFTIFLMDKKFHLAWYGFIYSHQTPSHLY